MSKSCIRNKYLKYKAGPKMNTMRFIKEESEKEFFLGKGGRGGLKCPG
jgi:hypothetical protein